jgi:hypothetical protein
VAGEERVRQARWRRSTTTSSHLERVSKGSVSLRDGTQDSVRSWTEVETESTGAAMLIGDPSVNRGTLLLPALQKACRKSLIHFSGPRIDFCKQKLAREDAGLARFLH